MKKPANSTGMELTAPIVVQNTTPCPVICSYNPAYQPIRVQPGQTFSITGVVLKTVRSFV